MNKIWKKIRQWLRWFSWFWLMDIGRFYKWYCTENFEEHKNSTEFYSEVYELPLVRRQFLEPALQYIALEYLRAHVQKWEGQQQFLFSFQRYYVCFHHPGAGSNTDLVSTHLQLQLYWCMTCEGGSKHLRDEDYLGLELMRQLFCKKYKI